MKFCQSTVLFAITFFLRGSDSFTPRPYPASSAVQQIQRFQPVLADLGVSVDEEDDFPDIDSPPADDYIVNVGELVDEDTDAVGAEDDGQPPAWAASQQRVLELRQKYRRNEKDTGSPEFQVAGMTERINYLTSHMQAHPNDYSTRRGLVAMVNKRRRLLNYLFQEDVERYKALVGSLGLRHKAPGRIENREEKYARFPKQKAEKKHFITKENK